MKHQKVHKLPIHEAPKTDTKGAVSISIGVIMMIGVIVGLVLLFTIGRTAAGNITTAPTTAATTTETPTTTSEVTTTSGPTTTPIPQTTPPPLTFPANAIKLFAVSSSAGNLGDRTATTAYCDSTATTAGFVCPGNLVALLSYTGDRIEDIPATFGIDGSRPLWYYNSPTELSSSLTTALSTGAGNKLLLTLNAAGLTTISGAAITNFATGFNSQGSPVPLINCNNWTDNTDLVNGVIGYKYALNSTWLEASETACDQARNYLCICY